MTHGSLSEPLTACSRAARRWLLTAAALGLTACGSNSAPVAPALASPGAVSALTASPVSATTVAGTGYFSSTKLGVAWTAPRGLSVVRYAVTWTDQLTQKQASASGATTSIVLSDLKSATPYRIKVIACTTTECADTSSASVLVTTPGEVWHFQGTGASAALAGRLLMYYGPLQQSAKGLAAGVTTSSFLSFASRAGSSGLLNPPASSALVREIATGQVVPLSAAMGGRMRLYFEAPDATNRTRILSLDSQDGYVGLDYHSGASGICSTTADYSATGGCAPSVVIGVAGDAVLGNARIDNARQFKIGYPTQSDWRWDGAAGTFMTFTTGPIPTCSTFPQNHGYAVWSGSTWVVQYESPGGCPKLFRSVQAGHPMHLADARYKLYYGDPSDVTGRITTSPLPFLGPKKLMYADGALTGDVTRVDFEDWEGVAAARVLTFLWPDGTTLNATARGYIDDFSIVAPTGSLALQVLYVAITDGIVVPFTSAAILINP